MSAMKIPSKCPHCHYGTLVDERGKGYRWSFACRGCGRVWIILDEKYWLAGFSASGEIYEIKDGKVVKGLRDYDPLYERLWDRVRK